MNLKEKMQQEINVERFANLETIIYAAKNKRHFRIELQEGVDVVETFFSRRLLPPGQKLWDKLVSLGFEPSFSFDMVDNIYLSISW